MGLDAWGFSTERKFDTEVDFRVSDNDPDIKLGYWRSCYDLQTWMAELYYEKGGRDAAFNCNPVALSEDDLADLLGEVKRGTFTDMRENDIAELITFIDRANEAIAQGLTVYYDSWW